MNARTPIPAVITTTHIMSLIADVDRTAREHEASLCKADSHDDEPAWEPGFSHGADKPTSALAAAKAVERVEAALETYAAQRAHAVENARQAGAAASITREASRQPKRPHDRPSCHHYLAGFEVLGFEHEGA